MLFRSLKTQGERVQYLCASSSGALLLGDAGLVTGQIVTTFPSLLETLWKYDPADVRSDAIVRNENGRLFSSRSSGAALMALEVVGRCVSPEVAAQTAEHLGVDWSE